MDTAGYEKILKEVKAKKYEVRYAPFEWYLNDPAKVSQEELLTKICFPIK